MIRNTKASCHGYSLASLDAMRGCDGAVRGSAVRDQHCAATMATESLHGQLPWELAFTSRFPADDGGNDVILDSGFSRNCNNNEVLTDITTEVALRRGSGVPQCNIVTMMPLATIALLCKQTIDNFRNHPPSELPMTPSIGLPVIICSSLKPIVHGIHFVISKCWKTYSLQS